MDFTKLDINTLILLASVKYLTAQAQSIPSTYTVNDIMRQALVRYLSV